ncbi:MAG: ABC transporter ATP-binding protein [Stomatobaculum sp.]|nr:ABC transporter ATP-binding protein [Stomatobaculum sp.]
MIKTTELTKRFDNVTALDHVNAEIREGAVFGLIGTNGAGKSTFLKLLTGILKPDEGEVLIDGTEIFGNPLKKEDFFYISDDQYFFANAVPADMEKFCSIFYPAFDSGRFRKLLKGFDLSPERKINTFSKGMKKQLSLLLGLSAGTKYLFCDETFDGLDPVMRQTVKSLFAEDMAERGLTPVIASHNLRELEDICDHVGLLHHGGILLSRDLDDMKLNIHKLQCVLKPGNTIEDLRDLDIVLSEQRGSLITLTVRGEKEAVLSAIQQKEPVFVELVPLSLEEIFICETEVKGYDIKKLVL